VIPLPNFKNKTKQNPEMTRTSTSGAGKGVLQAAKDFFISSHHDDEKDKKLTSPTRAMKSALLVLGSMSSLAIAFAFIFFSRYILESHFGTKKPSSILLNSYFWIGMHFFIEGSLGLLVVVESRKMGVGGDAVLSLFGRSMAFLNIFCLGVCVYQRYHLKLMKEEEGASLVFPIFFFFNSLLNIPFIILWRK